MKTLIQCLTVATIATSAVSSRAQEPAKTEPREAIQTTLEMRESAWKDYQKADEQLNKVFKHLLSQLENKSQKKKLREAQMAWLRYRDKNTEFAASFYEGGSMKSQYLTSWMTAMTVDRTKELQLIIDESIGE